MTFIPEITLKLILVQIFQILFMMLENKYYILDFGINSFSLFESDKIKDSYFIKYNNITSITNNLTYSIT